MPGAKLRLLNFISQQDLLETCLPRLSYKINLYSSGLNNEIDSTLIIPFSIITLGSNEGSKDELTPVFIEPGNITILPTGFTPHESKNPEAMINVSKTAIY